MTKLYQENGGAESMYDGDDEGTAKSTSSIG